MDEDDKTRIERIEGCFKDITKLSLDDTRKLIEDLADDNLIRKPLLHYYEYISKFKPLTIITDKLNIITGKLKIFENNNSSSFENNVSSVGKGAYGETFLGSRSGRVFKRITATFSELTKLNEFCRNILVESFIQTVVSTDPSDFTKNICKIKGVFKDKVKSEKMVDLTINKENKNYCVTLYTTTPLVYHELYDIFISAGATIKNIYLSEEANRYIIILTAPIAEQTISNLVDIYYDRDILIFNKLNVGSYNIKEIKVSLYIELEKLDTTFNTYINDSSKRAYSITYLNFKDNYLVPLASTLQYFNNKYKFYHGDLHTGNIMFSKDTLKIIDMGKACLIYNKKKYSADTSTGCISTDLGIFLVCFLEMYGTIIPQKTAIEINNLLTVSNGERRYEIWRDAVKIITEYNRLYPKNTARIYHLMYPWTAPWTATFLNNKEGDLLYKLIGSITPDYIMNKLNYVKIHGIAARRGGSRHNRKRRRNITRKA